MARNLVKPAEARLAKWSLKWTGSRVKELMDNGREAYIASARDAYIDQVQMEAAVKSFIGGQGVMPKDVVQYYNYARQLWKAARSYEGEVLSIRAKQLEDARVLCGLDRTVLAKLRFSIFTIPLPGEGQPA
jgi:hypothetical protein